MASEDLLTMSVPRISANEDNVTLVRWRYPSGSRVSQNDIVCEVESSKTVEEIVAERNGFLHYRAVEGEKLAVGGILAVIGSTDTKPNLDLGLATVETPPEAAADHGWPRMSAKARRLAVEMGLDKKLFDGLSVVREADVQAMADKAKPRRNKTVQLGVFQQRVAEAVTRSWAEIPTSMVEMRVESEPLVDKARDIGRRCRIMMSPTILAVAAFARAVKQFPVFNATLEDNEIRVWDEVNVNILTDVDGELFNPVIRSADHLEVADIARQFGELRKRVASRKATADDMTDGTVTVTSLFGTGVTRFSPILFPGQTAILGVSDIDSLAAPKTMTWGLAFDHRVANAVIAAKLLNVMIEKIEAL